MPEDKKDFHSDDIVALIGIKNKKYKTLIVTAGEKIYSKKTLKVIINEKYNKLGC